MTRPRLLLLKTPTHANPISPSQLLEVDHLSLLSTRFESFQFDDRRDWDGFIFCSQRAVKALELATGEEEDERRRRRLMRKKPCFVVGTRTRQALFQLLVDEDEDEDKDEEGQVTIVEGRGNGTGDSLAREIIKHFTLKDQDKEEHRLLFLCGDKTTESLPTLLLQSGRRTEREQGGGGGREPKFELETRQVYSTSVVTGFEEKFLQWLGRGTNKDEMNVSHKESRGNVWIGICSPSGGKEVLRVLSSRNLLPLAGRGRRGGGGAIEADRLENLGNRLRFVAIGPTTRDYLENEGRVKVSAMASSPSEQGMIDAVLAVENRETRSGD